VLHKRHLLLRGKHLTLRICFLKIKVAAAVIQMGMGIDYIAEIKVIFLEDLIDLMCLFVGKTGIDQETVPVVKQIDPCVGRGFNIIGISIYF